MKATFGTALITAVLKKEKKLEHEREKLELDEDNRTRHCEYCPRGVKF